jgi:hypothetical protein
MHHYRIRAVNSHPDKLTSNITPAATSALAAIVTSGLVGLVAHTIRMVKVATLAMLNPKQSALGVNFLPALRFFWNMVMCVAPMAR